MEPVAAGQIMQAVIAGAVVILTGALYALLFALGRLQASRLMLSAAYIAYGALAGAVFVSAEALNLTGFWLWLVAAMLLGYLLAPWGIWYLCVGTHRQIAERNADRPFSKTL